MTELAGEFAERLREELDFRQEARNATEIAAGLAGNNEVHVPVVHRELSTARVLVMEWLDGPSVREGDTIQDMGFDRARLANALLRCALKQMLVDGCFHADPHPETSWCCRAAGSGSSTSRPPAGWTPCSRRRCGRCWSPSSSAMPACSARQLFFTFGITLPPEFSTFFRALVTLEGTLTMLSPGYLVIEAAEQLATEWAKASLAPGSVEELVRRELASLALLLRRTPRHLERIATMIERGDLRARVSLLADEQDARAVARLVNRAVLALLGGVVGVLSVMLLGTQGGPPFTGDTSLFQFFGYFGLFCATVLILRVLVAVLRDGVS